VNQEFANIASFSLPGKKHANQDAVFAGKLANDSYLLVIADGMGGHNGGDVASKLATEVVINTLNDIPSQELDEVFQKVQSQFIVEAEKNKGFSQMGTTLTVCIVKEHNAYIGHVGDSRLYLLRNKGLKTITKDQTEVQRLIDDGVLNQKEAKKYPRRNVLLSVLSPSSEYILQKSMIPIKPNDRILLVTDGLYNVLSKEEIRNASIGASSISALCSTLETEAKLRDPKDDYSAVCFEVLP
jgi:protein phosphatase